MTDIDEDEANYPIKERVFFIIYTQIWKQYNCQLDWVVLDRKIINHLE